MRIQDCFDVFSGNISKGSNSKAAWEVTWSAALWTIWQCRNQVVFQNVRVKKSEILFLITHRSQSWCQAANLIESSDLWSSNPIGLVLKSSLTRQHRLLNNNAKLVGFIDGAWKKSPNNVIQAGIGGYVKDSEGNLVFIFSGPVKAFSPSQCEFEAMFYVVKQLAVSPWSTTHSVIYSDSADLIKEVRKAKFNFQHHFEDNIRKYLLFAKIEFKKVNRLLNCEADSLAKQGMTRSKLLSAWC